VERSARAAHHLVGIPAGIVEELAKLIRITGGRFALDAVLLDKALKTEWRSERNRMACFL